MTAKEKDPKQTAEESQQPDVLPIDEALEEKAPADDDAEVVEEESASVEEEGDALAADLANIRGELEAANSRTLRAQAELENFRRRSSREMEDVRKFAAVPLVRDLVAVIDNVQRAIQAAESAQADGGLLEGFRMVAKQLDETLARHGCHRIASLHQAFDPNVHEAVSQIPSAEHSPGTVIEVLQDGYLMHDRVVRPAQVIVSAAPPDA